MIVLYVLSFFCYHLECVDNLDGSIDEPVEDGDTALHLTCLYGHLPCVQVACRCFDVWVISLFFSEFNLSRS